MDLKPRGYAKVVELVEKGATVPNPFSLDIGDEVDVARFSGKSVTLYPGCRIYGAGTVISSGVKLGAEGPVTLDDCRLGPGVELKGGYFKKSVFLEKANMGSGAQVREGCLLEEEANGAHCVGLKQTILFPFVTLGSLINFCDCFMAGGTSRKDHSEVGSSYIHFNFTPDGDKTTASLFGDVPRGVMLDQPPIFLGGQGGAVGPVQVGFGTVIAAGSILRRDVPEDGKLVAADLPPDFVRDRHPFKYRGLTRIVRNNVVYLANLVALEEWYRKVRRPFFALQEMGELVYEGALEVLAQAKEERIKRLQVMAEKVPGADPGSREFHERGVELRELFTTVPELSGEQRFLAAFQTATAGAGRGYIETVQGLTPDISGMGVQWLEQIVEALCTKADELLPTMELFGGKH
ncbi:MAG: UDP-N-acetylglucosamine pyrophosphorylase [Thermoleophilia bacterium]|nr:UDP-N-acetylglucosamine pyrophosphorylase [Thermoleophilia bacterium]